jgi:hypothetical protein
VPVPSGPGPPAQGAARASQVTVAAFKLPDQHWQPDPGPGLGNHNAGDSQFRVLIASDTIMIMIHAARRSQGGTGPGPLFPVITASGTLYFQLEHGMKRA